MESARKLTLRTALASRELVLLTRRFEKARIRGYILGLGPKWVLVAIISDRLWYDGFECFRRKDIQSVEPDPYAAFAEAALAKRGQGLVSSPDLPVRSLRELLEAAGKLFPLLTIHREKLDRGVCHIGSFQAINRRQVALLEITPAAQWRRKARAFELRDVTCVGFGASYEQALALVGGASVA